MTRNHTMRNAVATFALLATFAVAAPALAANPDFDAVPWTPLTCGATPLTSPSSPAVVNIVGDATYPPTYYAYDAGYLYFRHRVDRDPKGGGGFASDVWTALMQIPTGNPFQYQYQLSLNGKSNTMEIWANTVASDVVFNPNFHDDSEVQLWTRPYDQLGGAIGNTSPLARSLATGDGSNFNGDADYFVDFAFPVSVLVAEGLVADWSELGDSLFFPATSTTASSYNKGFLNCPFLPQTELDITKTVAPLAVPANVTTPLTYTITVANTSAYPAKGVVIEDIALPAYMANVAADVSSDQSDATWTVESVNPLSVKVGVLKSGYTMTVVLSADATPACDPDFTNVATTRATNTMDTSNGVTLVTHTPELCDGFDNDCNGEVDEGGSALCSDGDACNGVETCGGVDGCQAGTPVVCTASDQCHVAGTCDPATGTCDDPAAADGTACNDNDACTQSDACAAGACVGSNPVLCAASDQCHVAGTCDPATGTCDDPAAADGTACSDGDACTEEDICLDGACVPGAISPSCVEICGNCIDDDGDGLVDAEDPDCCAAPMELALKKLSIRLPSRKAHGHKLRLKARFASFVPEGFDPMTQDTSLQIADANGQVFCQTIAAQNWKHRRRRVYNFRDKVGSFAGGLKRGKFKMKKKGDILFKTAGKKMDLPPTDGSNVMVTLRVGDQCAQAQMTLRTRRKGFVFP
jgi:uncharacterized repeat protein (TIGR01451 family)